MANPTIEFIFVSQAGFIHRLTGKIICFFTQSKLAAHVAVRFVDKDGKKFLVESTHEGVHWEEDPDMYEDDEQREVYSFIVTQEVYDACFERAKELVENKTTYGWEDCFFNGVHDCVDLFNESMGEVVAERLAGLFDNPNSKCCSGTALIIGREYIPSFCAGYEDSVVSPEDFREYLANNFTEACSYKYEG